MAHQLANSAIPVVVNNRGARSFGIAALLRQDGKIVLDDGFCMGPGDVAFALATSEWQLEKDAEKLFDRVFEVHGTSYLSNMQRLSEQIDREAVKVSEIPKIVSVLGISFVDDSDWKAKRYAAANGNPSTMGAMEKLDELSPTHDPEKIRAFVAMSYLRSSHEFTPGYLHLKLQGNENHETVANALNAWRSGGGRLGKTALDYLYPPEPVTVCSLPPPQKQCDWNTISERWKRLGGTYLEHFATPMERALLEGVPDLRNRTNEVATRMALRIEDIVGREWTGGRSPASISMSELDDQISASYARCFAFEDKYATPSSPEGDRLMTTSPWRMKTLWIPLSDKDAVLSEMDGLAFEHGVLTGSRQYLRMLASGKITPERWVAIEFDRTRSGFVAEPDAYIRHIVEQACSHLEDGYAGGIFDLDHNEAGVIYSGGGVQHTFHENWRVHCNDNGRTKILMDMDHAVWSEDATERTHELCNCLTTNIPKVLESIQSDRPMVRVMHRGYAVGVAFHNPEPRLLATHAPEPVNADKPSP